MYQYSALSVAEKSAKWPPDLCSRRQITGKAYRPISTRLWSSPSRPATISRNWLMYRAEASRDSWKSRDRHVVQVTELSPAGRYGRGVTQ